MLLDTVFVRTRTGALAFAGGDAPLSGGFRRLLRLIDGKCNGREVLAAMPQLDEEDFGLWMGELMRQMLIAPKDDVPVDDMAFQMTGEMPANMLGTASAEDNAMIDDIMADVVKGLGGKPDVATRERLQKSARMAAIESASTQVAVGKAGYFVYPDAAEGLPDKPRVCIAGHIAAQNRVLELLIMRAGVKPRVVASRDAMRAALAEAEKPHILIIDAEMPALDPWRTIEAMRVDAELRRVRVVIVSAKGERADLAQAMLLGAAAYMVKPLRKDVLDAALPQILGRPAVKP